MVVSSSAMPSKRKRHSWLSPIDCRGVRAVVGVGRRTWCCRGRRAAASGFSKRKVTINMLLGGAVARRGGGGGTASGTAAVRNNVPHASRSAAAAFFARMDVQRAAATMAGAAMLSRWRLRVQMLDGATRGGGLLMVVTDTGRATSFTSLSQSRAASSSPWSGAARPWRRRSGRRFCIPARRRWGRGLSDVILHV